MRSPLAIHLLAVAYSPTPIGIRPSKQQSLDFFTAEYRNIYMRDLPRMRHMGANTIRVYALDGEASHLDFYDACHHYNISVIGSFGLEASQYNLRDELSVMQAELNLRRQLDELRHGHPAVLMWMVGNELNLPSAGFLCDPHTHGMLIDDAPTCQFNGSEVALLFGVVDRLCGIVHSFGYLCTTALAEFPLPASYAAPSAAAAARANGIGAPAWFSALDTVVRRVDVWSTNLYRPGGFGDWFYAYRSLSERPVVVSEYGVDSFDSGWGANSECEWPPCRRMRENGAAQAQMLTRLTEQILRNTVTCVGNCDSHVTAGGVAFSWVDEWFKGEGPHGAHCNGPVSKRIQTHASHALSTTEARLAAC